MTEFSANLSMYFWGEFVKHISGDPREFDLDALNGQHFPRNGEDDETNPVLPPGDLNYFVASKDKESRDTKVSSAQRLANALKTANLSDKDGRLHLANFDFLLEKASQIFYGKGQIRVPYMTPSGQKMTDTFSGICQIPLPIWDRVVGNADSIRSKYEYDPNNPANIQYVDEELTPRTQTNLMQRVPDVSFTQLYNLKGPFVYRDFLIVPTNLYQSWERESVMQLDNGSGQKEYYKLVGGAGSGTIGSQAGTQSAPKEIPGFPADRKLYRISVISKESLMFGFRNVKKLKPPAVFNDENMQISPRKVLSLMQSFYMPINIRPDETKFDLHDEFLFTFHYGLRKIQHFVPERTSAGGTKLRTFDRGINHLDFIA